MIETITRFFELQTFGVCTWWGKKLGIDSNRIRKTFIYTSFITFGSPLIIYMAMAFILENKEYFKPGGRKSPSVWEFDGE
ncbi:MAG TPA: PspC family transcriptional regulator [Luteibaculaceae bacterium]|nr:PspC family transcriptional regulator [Luteibaculaceae bacterium]